MVGGSEALQIEVTPQWKTLQIKVTPQWNDKL